EPAKPQAAAPAPAATSGAHGGLPAALFGIALLLAVVGTILVRARRRMIRVHDDAARGVNDGAARRAARPRRSLREILAQAEPEPDVEQSLRRLLAAWERRAA